jgi:hypothetical protein
MSLSHVMCDIETLGTGRDAAIVSIGAVRFNPYENIPGSVIEFHARIDLAKSKDIGVIDASTVEWWLKQDKAAQDALTSGDRETLSAALTRFCQWMSHVPVEGFWSNGPMFDERIIRDAYERTGSKGFSSIVTYRASRCMRTICDLGRTLLASKLPKEEFTGVRHDALADAVYQAKVVTTIIQALKVQP